MINSVPIQISKRSSSSKTKSIGKYTTNKKKEEDKSGQKYHTQVKVRMTTEQFEISGKRKYSGKKSPRTSFLRAKKNDLMDRMLNEKLS